jgi:phosphoribosylformimino-5-aminoimidazole carboxamide ribotide isomerase
MAVIASGGISSVEHLRRLKLIGVEGAIIGKALYTGVLDIHEALAAAR